MSQANRRRTRDQPAKRVRTSERSPGSLSLTQRVTIDGSTPDVNAASHLSVGLVDSVMDGWRAGDKTEALALLASLSSIKKTSPPVA